MADLDTIYSAHNEITDAGENAPQHVEAYSRIIEGTQGTEGSKILAAQFIPTFFKHFPSFHSRAIDGLFDLCEDEITSVRRAAIKALPSLCKDGPQHTIKIADVLCQLLQLDGEDLVIVQGALQTLLEQNPREVLAVLFRQGIKGELRDKTLSFINNQVVASFQTRLSEDPEIERFFVDEIQKAMSSVSDSELEAFAKIIMQTQLYQTGALDLVGLSHIYMAHITSEGRWKIVNPESIKRVLVAGKLSMPLFQRNISADPLLEFFASNILPCSEFKQLANEQRAKFLRLFADSITSGHPSPAVLSRVGRLVSDLLVMIVPAKQDGSSTVEFVQVEYLLFILNYFIKDPDLLERDELVARFRNLYNSTQIQLSRIKNEIKIASATASRDANQEAEAKRLTRIQAIHSNVHALVAEFLRPKTLRTKVILHPSWKPTPEVQPAVAKKGASNPAPRKTPNLPTKPAAKVTPGSSAKVTAQSNTRSGAMPMPQQPQNKPSHPQQQQGPSKKRKAEPESNTNQKKPKITRPHGPSTVGSTPVSITLGGRDSVGAKQLDIHGQVQAQLQERAQVQARAKAVVHTKAQAQTQHQQRRQPQRQQPLKQHSQPLTKRLPKVSSKSSPRVVHGSHQHGRASGLGNSGHGSYGAGRSGNGGLTSPSLMSRPTRRRDTKDRINFLQPR